MHLAIPSIVNFALENVGVLVHDLDKSSINQLSHLMKFYIRINLIEVRIHSDGYRQNKVNKHLKRRDFEFETSMNVFVHSQPVPVLISVSGVGGFSVGAGLGDGVEVGARRTGKAVGEATVADETDVVVDSGTALDESIWT